MNYLAVPPAAGSPKTAANSRSFGSELSIPERASFAQRLMDFITIVFLAIFLSTFGLAGAAVVGVVILLFV